MVPLEVLLTDTARTVLASLTEGKTKDLARAKKVDKTIQMLAVNPHHPGLASHRYEALDKTWGETVWQSYVENNTPAAWRVWWYFGPTPNTITVLDIGAHP